MPPSAPRERAGGRSPHHLAQLGDTSPIDGRADGCGRIAHDDGAYPPALFGRGAVARSGAGQPLEAATFHAGVVETEPRLTEVGELEERVLEPAEGAPSGDGPRQHLPRPGVPHTADEVLEVAVALSRR